MEVQFKIWESAALARLAMGQASTLSLTDVQLEFKARVERANELVVKDADQAVQTFVDAEKFLDKGDLNDSVCRAADAVLGTHEVMASRGRLLEAISIRDMEGAEPSVHEEQAVEVCSRDCGDLERRVESSQLGNAKVDYLVRRFLDLPVATGAEEEEEDVQEEDPVPVRKASQSPVLVFLDPDGVLYQGQGVPNSVDDAAVQAFGRVACMDGAALDVRIILTASWRFNTAARHALDRHLLLRGVSPIFDVTPDLPQFSGDGAARKRAEEIKHSLEQQSAEQQRPLRWVAVGSKNMALDQDFAAHIVVVPRMGLDEHCIRRALAILSKSAGSSWGDSEDTEEESSEDASS